MAAQQTDWVDREAERLLKARLAALRAELTAVCGVIPKRVRDGSINTVREWKEARQAALKLAKRPGAGKSELTAAITNMQRFK